MLGLLHPRPNLRKDYADIMLAFPRIPFTPEPPADHKCTVRYFYPPAPAPTGPAEATWARRVI